MKKTGTPFPDLTSDGRVEYNIADNQPYYFSNLEREENKMSETSAPLKLGLIETELAVVIVILALILLQGVEGEEEEEEAHDRGRDKDKGKDGKKDNKENKNNSFW